MRTLASLLFLLLCVTGYGQTDLVFSTHQSYNLEVVFENYSYTKPHNWQVRFNNVSARQYQYTVTVSNNDKSYSKTQSFWLTVGDGEEVVIFIIPYTGELQYSIAYIARKAGATQTGNQVGADGRPLYHQGRPVFSVKQVKELKQGASQRWDPNEVLEFLKNATPNAWLYTEDIIQLMPVFWDELYKANLAIFAYDNVIDKHLYYKLESQFWDKSHFDRIIKSTSGK